ncbi:MAG: enoyl-CoA hydratase/isomerase family protein [Planctomycetes bacterium]|nr:enoyl-CoA hydratase/isomerase family protein [Planctomycetota bacterium]
MFKSYTNWLIDSQDGIAILKINREKHKNSLNVDSIQELEDILEVIANDDSIKAFVITAVGRVFGIGAHIPEILESNDAEKSRNLSTAGQKIFSKILAAGKPSCAAINGIFCLGGSFELTLSCTFRIASKRCRLGLPEVSLGVVPGYGGTQLLPKMVGLTRANEMILTGIPIKAEDALNFGILNAVCEPNEEINTAIGLLTKVLKNGPLAVKQAMKLLQQSFDMKLIEGLDAEATGFSMLRATSDANEGLTANQENRKADFKGI